MPPIKGRMLGQPQQGGVCPAVNQANIGFKTVKNIGLPRKKGKYGGVKHGVTIRNLKNDESLLKLRIPSNIRKSLPSVKKFGQGKLYVDITDDENEGDVKMDVDNVILGAKRGRGLMNKYHIKAFCERKFGGMIWDTIFTATGEILVSCGVGIHVCDEELHIKKTLVNIRIGGGVALLSDGRIVGLCRFTDEVNIYSPDGTFLKHFVGGSSPMMLIVNSQDEIIISDVGPGSKTINFYSTDGVKLRTIEQSGAGYSMLWPLYLSLCKGDSVVVTDCHLQKVLKFDSRGRYVKSIPLDTFGGNVVLRPHGLCFTSAQDMLIIDNAIDTVEVFSPKGAYLQTLVPSEEGSCVHPKVLAYNNKHLAIGGLKGLLKLYTFVDMDTVKPKIEKTNFIKKEIKTEMVDEVIVLD